MEKKRTYLIAEAGVNHNGFLKQAKELIEVARQAGADAVKFQTFRAGQLASLRAGKTPYQKKTTRESESQLEMLRRLELDEKAHRELSEYCRKQGIEFLSTPFDETSVNLLAHQLKLKRLKVPSGEITNARLLLAIGRTGLPIMMSTGMATREEIKQAVSVFAFAWLFPLEARPSQAAFREAFKSKKGQRVLKEKVTLLQCTSEYPAPFGEINLRAMDDLQSYFGIPVGLSDHSRGIAVALAAVARGAVVIEKHFTLDRNLPGPDHKASLEPSELKAMVEGIRQVEEALGSSRKSPTPSELKNRSVVRRSLVAGRRIRKGEKFTEENLTAKRPEGGISPMRYWEVLGKPAPRDFEADEAVRV